LEQEKEDRMNRPHFLIGTAIIFIASSPIGTARAQITEHDAAKTVAMCARISSDLQRLACYDDLSRQVGGGNTAQKDTAAQAANPQTTPATPAIPNAMGPSAGSSDAGGLGAWVRNDEVDGLDNSKIIILSLPAESGNVGLIGKPGMKRGPVLVMRCKERQAQLFVSFDLPVTGSEDAVPVRYRIGASAPTKGVWARSEDETSFGAWKTATTAPLVNQLGGAADLFVRVSGSNGRTSEALFKLDGIKAAIKAVQEGCPW
jgi:type VI secretion system VasI family protein